ncbi:MAG: hypothetical protein IJT25_03625 [Clostridia bacterium]|nr:hypothetical protein [Clostridia bacterium]
MNTNNEGFSKEGLYNLNIHELRKLGSQVGVKSPSSLNKESLVEAIFSIVVGDIKPYKQKDRRGRPQKATIEDVSLTNLYSYNDAGLMKVASETVSTQGEIKTGSVVLHNGNMYARVYPFVESPDDAIISKAYEKDYALREYDVLTYYVANANARHKEVGKIITINNCPVSDYDVMFNRLSKTSLLNSKLKVQGASVNAGSNVAINANVDYKTTALCEKIASEIKGDYKVVSLCLEKEEKANTNDTNDMFVSLSTDNVMAGLVCASKAINRAKSYICEDENVVLIIDNFNSLVKIYEANYKNNAEAFIKRLLGFAGQYSNGKNLTIISLADRITNVLMDYNGVFNKIV